MSNIISIDLFNILVNNKINISSGLQIRKKLIITIDQLPRTSKAKHIEYFLIRSEIISA